MKKKGVQMKKKWIKGSVRWFDNLKGQGFIRCNDEGICYPIHYSAIQSKETWKTLQKNEPVKFQIHEDYKWTQVSKLKKGFKKKKKNGSKEAFE